MKIEVELTEKDLRKLVLSELQERTGLALNETDIHIEVKSTNNYRAEWEPAAFRARVSKLA